MQNKNNQTLSNLIVLGIDPGYGRLGLAIVEKKVINNKTKDCLIYSECLETSSKDDHYKRIAQIGAKIESVIHQFKPNLLSIETLFFTSNQKTAMKVAEVRGIAIYEATKNNLSIYEVSPLEVKMAITGYGKSDKNQVTEMVKRIITIEKKNSTIDTKTTNNNNGEMNNKSKLDDEYDAIALAITGINSYPQKIKLLQKK